MNIFHLTELGANRLTARQILAEPRLCLAFGFGTGLARKAPGTFGTLAGFPIYALLLLLPEGFYLPVTVLLSALGIGLCGYASQRLGDHDHGGIVYDEMAGLWLTLWAIPVTAQALIAGFVLFRLFDIVKPWPIRWLDRNVSGGLGIMLDDILAAVFANLLLHWWF